MYKILKGDVLIGETKLIFRTKSGSETINADSSKNIASNLIVKNYPEIRVLYENRTSSKSSVTFNIVLIDKNEFIGFLDTVVVLPGENYTTVYPIPGAKISILAAAGNGDAYIDLFVYGYDPKSNTCTCCNRYF